MGNDILAKWQPSIDYSRFAQGQISNAIWMKFCEFIELCHAVSHFQALEAESRRDMRIIGLRKREIDQYRRSSESNRTLKFRARFLAAEACFDMASKAISDEDKKLVQTVFEGTQLSFTDTIRGHETANFVSFSLKSYPPI